MLQKQAKGVIGSDSKTLAEMFESMLESAETSLADYEHLRAPQGHVAELKLVIDATEDEVDALRRVVKAARSRSSAELTTALRDLAEAMGDRESALQGVLTELRKNGSEERRQ